MATKEATKDPKGGLTAEGRRYFARKEGSHLKPGVRGAADTPEKMRRKGSFLRRHFANPRGPLRDEAGKPTRLALSAHAWGESVPATLAAARRLAQKGARLLERYAKTKTRPKAARGTSSGGSPTNRRKTSKRAARTSADQAPASKRRKASKLAARTSAVQPPASKRRKASKRAA